MKEITISFQLRGDEIERFEKAFELSGFRSKSEFIRFALFSEIKQTYGV